LLSRTGLTCIGIALAPLLVVAVIWAQYPLVPVWDQWFLIPFFEKVASGDATLADWVARHRGEVHHIVVPRLVFTGLAFASDWTMKLEIWGSFAIALAMLWALLRMVRAGFDDRLAAARDVALVIAAWLLFSLVQIWNWLWGFSLMLFLINACVVIGAELLRSSPPGRFGRALGLAALCCLLASFSMAHGVLSWLALAPAVFWFAPPAGRARSLAVWAGLAAATWTLFLWGYSAEDAPTTGGLLERMVEHPLLLPGYFLILLGSPLGWTSDAVGDSTVALSIIAAVGLCVCLAFAVLFVRLFPRVSATERDALVAWGCVGLFSILYAGLNTLGRAKPFFLDPLGYELARVWLSMYATPAGLVSIAAAVLALRTLAESKGRVALPAGAGLLGLVIVVNDLQEMPAPEHLERDQQTLCFELMDRWATANTCMNLISYADEVAALERIGWRAPRAGVVRVELAVEGGVDAFEPGSGGVWGTLVGRVSPRGDVAEALSDAGHGRSAVLLSRAGHDRFFAYAMLDGPGAPRSTATWRVELDKRAVARDVEALQAWLYVRSTGEIAKIGQPFAWRP
jgi:hypothetical protein